MRHLFILSFFFFTPFTNVLSGEPSIRQAMVVTAHTEASRIGADILNQGGNAIDAAVAVMFALGVVEPWASGLGGGGYMLIKLVGNPTPIVINFREKAPGGALPKRFYRNSDDFRYLTGTGYRSICIPGMAAGAELALKKYGRMSVQQVLAPAIELAHHGVEVSAHFNHMSTDYYDLIEMNRATSDIFLPGWLPVNEGELLIRNDLAITMEMLALKGLNAFYRDDLAADIVNDIQDHDGILTLADFNSYSATEKTPMSTAYRGYQIYVPPLHSSGGVALLHLLNILECYRLKELGHNSGKYIHVVAEALKHTLLDRITYDGDPAFAKINVSEILSKQYAQRIQSKIDTTNAWKLQTLTSNIESDNASHVSIIDKQGNAVSLTQSLTFYFGSGVTHPKTGILFNNGLFHFSRDSSHINSIQPQKTSASSMTPCIILKNNQPFLILGTTSSDRAISTLAQIIINVIDFDMDIESAISAPRFHYENGNINFETRIESDAIEQLKKYGHAIRLKTDYHSYFGNAQAIKIDPVTGNVSGASDPRGEGKVMTLK